MTRLLFSGDHHFDEHGRFAECIAVHDWMVDYARMKNVDAFVSTGDVYERASTPAERDAVSRWLIKMAEVCPVFIAKGNHDRDLDCAIMGKLKSEHPIFVEEACGLYRIGDVALTLVAWPERARLIEVASQVGVSVDDVTQDALRSLFSGLRLQMESMDARRRIVAGHFMVDGSVTSVGQPLFGNAMNVGLSDFDLLGADVVVMGHIHKPQEWITPCGTDVLYTGSPYRTTFGEVEEKGVVLLDTEGDLLGSAPPRSAPACSWCLSAGNATRTAMPASPDRARCTLQKAMCSALRSAFATK